VPHTFGCPAEIDKIIGLGIPVIEDATQALGENYLEKKLGSYGLISIFSLYSSKMITTGTGGILLTDSKEIFDKIKFLGDYEVTVVEQRFSESSDYHIQYNYKMSDLNAILGISQLDQIDDFIKRRKEIAKIYNNAFKDLAELPVEAENHTFWRYPIKIKKDQVSLIKKALEQGIELGRGVHPALHRFLKLDNNQFLNTEKACSSLIVLPTYPSFKEEEIDYLVEKLKEIL
jgi:perosamine synthetase